MAYLSCSCRDRRGCPVAANVKHVELRDPYDPVRVSIGWMLPIFGDRKHQARAGATRILADIFRRRTSRLGDQNFRLVVRRNEELQIIKSGG
jgi:hypothetical protein